MNEYNFFPEYHAANAVCQDNVSVQFKIYDILMASRFIDPGITVYTQVESLVVLNECFIESRQQYVIAAAQRINGNNQQSVVFAGIASDNGCIQISACTVCGQYFTFERILKVPQFIFVKLQIRHKYSIKQ